MNQSHEDVQTQTLADQYSIHQIPHLEVVTHIRTVTTISSFAIERLLKNGGETPRGLGEFLEDIGNTYLDLADAVANVCRRG